MEYMDGETFLGLLVPEPPSCLQVSGFRIMPRK